MSPCFNRRRNTILLIPFFQCAISFLYCSVTTGQAVSLSSCLSSLNAKHASILHIVRVLADLVSFYFCDIFTNSTTTNVISINEKQYSVLCKTLASRGPSGGHLSPQHLLRTNRMVEFKVNMSSQD